MYNIFEMKKLYFFSLPGGHFLPFLEEGADLKFLQRKGNGILVKKLFL